MFLSLEKRNVEQIAARIFLSETHRRLKSDNQIARVNSPLKVSIIFAPETPQVVVFCSQFFFCIEIKEKLDKTLN